MENASVEWGRATFKEGGNLVTGAEGSPAATWALEREPLGERFGRAAPAAEGDGAKSVRRVTRVDVREVRQSDEGEGAEVRRLPSSGLPGRADEGVADPALAAVVQDEASPLEEGHFARGGGRRRGVGVREGWRLRMVGR